MSGQVQERIEQALRANFAPTVLEVINESGMHAVPAGSETHFKVVVVSARFTDKSRVQRHQLVFEPLRAEMKTGLHALSIVAKTPEEWAQESVIPASPKCLGGSAQEKNGHS